MSISSPQWPGYSVVSLCGKNKRLEGKDKTILLGANRRHAIMERYSFNIMGDPNQSWMTSIKPFQAAKRWTVFSHVSCSFLPLNQTLKKIQRAPQALRKHWLVSVLVHSNPVNQNHAFKMWVVKIITKLDKKVCKMQTINV